MKNQTKKINDLNKTLARCTIHFKPPEMLTVSEWSDKYRKLSPENSAEAGQWKTKRTPYLKEIMDAFTDPKIHRLVVTASSQVGKTEAELCMMAYVIANDPGPMLLVMPTLDVMKDFSKRRVAPMIRDTKPLRDRIAKSKSKDSDNTILKKSYPGGMLSMLGSNAPGPLAGTPARYVFGDERDRWAKEAGTEGDPWGLLEARTITFYNYKMVEVSTPTVKGASAIEASFALGTQEYWSVKCPHCGEYQFIRFNDIRFEHTSEVINNKRVYRVLKVEYCCPACGCISSESEIRKSEFKWIAKNPDAYKNGVRSFWINAFSSPWMTWEKIVLKFLEAKDDPQKLKTVYNTLFGELWEERSDVGSEDEMLARCEEYPADVPQDALCLTMGVDTQDNRLEYEVVGWGRNNISWGIEKGFIMGKPSDDDVWERLDAVIDRHYMHESGKALKISATFIDSGGHYTQEVYERCSQRIGKRVFAIKGQGGEGIPFIKPPSKADIVREDHVVGKTWLYVIGVDAGKERIMSSLKVESSDRAYFCHFPKDRDKGYDIGYFNGLLSERMVLKTNGKWAWEKLPGHNRNEALDCRNYALAAYRILKPDFDKIYSRIYDKKTDKEKPQKVLKKQKKKNLSQMGDW